ncbi:MAG: uridine kinase [Anaerolineaceae bacterium]|nr:uridine kinase [Anaerolineaceae bacterium]
MAMKKSPLVVGIAGGSGSGKTTLAELILEEIGADRISFLPHDAYYRNQDHLSYEERIKVNYDHPDSLETELLIEHIHSLLNGKSIELPVYDFTVHSRKNETIRIEPRSIILVEGILIFYDKLLRNIFDVKLFVDADSDIRFIRRLNRDITERGRSVDSVIHQYQSTVRPMYLEFVEASKRYADIIIPEGGKNSVALDMVIARLENLLGAEESHGKPNP